jgi:argonaute-like protein implicated in RNA metabolism and viral defense
MKNLKNLILLTLLTIILSTPIITYADTQTPKQHLTISDVALTNQTITTINYNKLAQCYTMTTTPKDNTNKSFIWLLSNAKQTPETTKELTNKYLNKSIQILYSTTDNHIFRAGDVIDWQLSE